MQTGKIASDFLATYIWANCLHILWHLGCPRRAEGTKRGQITFDVLYVRIGKLAT